MRRTAIRWSFGLIAIFAVPGCAGNGGDQAAVSSTSSTTATTPPTTTTTTGAKVSSANDQEAIFLQVMKDKGVYTAEYQKNLLLVEADMYCRYLRQGVSRQQLFTNAGLPGSDARLRAEAVFYPAVLSFCPEMSAAATR